MYSRYHTSQGGAPPLDASRIAAFALRNAGKMYEVQFSTMRTLLKAQARAATAFGLPDWSGLFDAAGDRTQRLFSDSAEQVLNAAQHANDAVSELQRQVSRVLEAQVAQVVDSWHLGIEEASTNANDSLEQLCETVRQAADEAARCSELLSQKQREAMHQSTEQIGAEAEKGIDRARQMFSQNTDAAQNMNRPEGQDAGVEQKGMKIRTGPKLQPGAHH